MIQFLRTNSAHPGFAFLVELLNADLAFKNGADHSFYAQFNSVDKINNVVLALEKDKPVACGGIREYAPGTMEVKRMFTLPEFRGRGLGASVLSELETWARELSYRRCILETGQKQQEAIRLYRKSGYIIFPNYGPYQGVENSVCFEKLLT